LTVFIYKFDCEYWLTRLYHRTGNAFGVCHCLYYHESDKRGLSVIASLTVRFLLPNSLVPCAMLITVTSGLIRGLSALAVAIWETVAQLAKEFANLRLTTARATESTLDKWERRLCECCAVGIKALQTKTLVELRNIG